MQPGHEARYWGRAQGGDRLLLILGAVALLALVPMLWIWLVYGSGVTGATLWIGGVGLSIMTAGIGWAMLKLLDGAR